LRNRELFAQIVVRESRLNLAEALNHDMKRNLLDFTKNIDDLDSAVALITADGETPDRESLKKLSGDIQAKTQKIRMHIAELDARIEKTLLEWEALKKNEIGLSTLETQIRKFLHQE